MSKTYGWTDETIMDLTVARLRQVLANIQQDAYMEQRSKMSFETWQTRQIATFIAAGYMTDGKKGNPAVDAAQNLAYDEIEQLQLEEAQKAAADAPLVRENKPGSFERFMGSMGAPATWK